MISKRPHTFLRIRLLYLQSFHCVYICVVVHSSHHFHTFSDPYFMRNHLGTYECKLCLTLHNNEASYLAHTQGKKHQNNLARRAAKEARDAPIQPAPEKARVDIKKFVKIGRPGYRFVPITSPMNFKFFDFWVQQACFFNHFAAMQVNGFSKTLSLAENSLSLAKNSLS